MSEDDCIDLYEDLDDVYVEKEKGQIENLNKGLQIKYNNALETISKLQEEKKGLEKKVKIMEINFKSLIETVRNELARKDTLIDTLRKEKDDICFRRKFSHQSNSNQTQSSCKDVSKDETNNSKNLRRDSIEKHSTDKHNDTKVKSFSEPNHKLIPSSSKSDHKEEKNDVSIHRRVSTDKNYDKKPSTSKNELKHSTEQNNDNNREAFSESKDKPRRTYSKYNTERETKNLNILKKDSEERKHSTEKYNEKKREHFSESKYKEDSTYSKIDEKRDMTADTSQKSSVHKMHSTEKNNDSKLDTFYESKSKHKTDSVLTSSKYSERLPKNKESLQSKSLDPKSSYNKRTHTEIADIEAKYNERNRYENYSKRSKDYNYKESNNSRYRNRYDRDNNYNEKEYRKRDTETKSNKRKYKNEFLNQQKYPLKMHDIEKDCGQLKIKQKRNRGKRNKNMQNEKCAENCVKDTSNLKTAKMNRRKKKKEPSSKMINAMDDLSNLIKKEYNDDIANETINNSNEEKLFKCPNLIKSNCDTQLKQSNLKELLNEYRTSIFGMCIKSEPEDNENSETCNEEIFAEETDDENLYTNSYTDTEQIVIDETDEEHFISPIPTKSFYNKPKVKSTYDIRNNLQLHHLVIQPKLEKKIESDKNDSLTGLIKQQPSMDIKYRCNNFKNQKQSFWNGTKRSPTKDYTTKNFKVPISLKKVVKEESNKMKKYPNNMVHSRIQCLESLIDFHEKYENKNFNVQLRYKDYLNLYMKLKKG